MNKIPCTIANPAKLRAANGVFVTGTDTGVGKSMVAAACLHSLVKQGIQAVGMKPVASGAQMSAAGLRNEDALLLQRYSAAPVAYQLLNPVCFAEPIAPHIAAARESQNLNLTALYSSFQTLAAQYEAVVVEGVGGWLVPLNKQEDFSDLAALIGLPVVLVVAIRLGCINHALLTVDAILRKGTPLLGWVANCLEPQAQMLDEQIETLRERIAAPCLGVVPALAPLTVEQVATKIVLR